MIESFIKSQQKFIEDWAKSPQKEWENSIFSKLKSVNSKIEPFLEYLPEPYLGDPFNADAVFLSYNPGPVFLDDTQHRTKGVFIKDFKAIETYHYFAINTPYFIHTSGFWADRKKFLSRLMNKPFQETKIFALEICPFHSSSFKLSQSDLLKSKLYIQKNVLNIAESVANQSPIKTIISVGKDYYNLFNLLEFQLVKEINQSLTEKNWPLKNGKIKINRSISLWKSPSGGIYFNTWAPGSNKMSSRDFDIIIKNIMN
jgi:hypothetical protein